MAALWAGELVALTVDGTERVMTSGAKLPVVLGFQGFTFVRLALRSPELLPATVKVRVLAVLPGLVEVSTPLSTVKTQGSGAGWMTRDVAIILNDMPLADLAGKPAEVGISVDTKTCRRSASAAVCWKTAGGMGRMRRCGGLWMGGRLVRFELWVVAARIWAPRSWLPSGFPARGWSLGGFEPRR